MRALVFVLLAGCATTQWESVEKIRADHRCMLLCVKGNGFGIFSDCLMLSCWNSCHGLSVDPNVCREKQTEKEQFKW